MLVNGRPPKRSVIQLAVGRANLKLCRQATRARGMLTRHPIGIMSEEPVDEAHLVNDKKPEGQADES